MPHSHYRRLDLFCLRRVSFVLLAVLWMSLLAGSGVRAAAISFAPPVTYNVTGAVGPVTADLDGDGHLDMVGSGALGLYLFYGIGDGTFEAHIDLGIIGGWTTVVDVNGDGRVDIVTGQGNTVGVMLNQGQRSFAPPVAYPVGHLPSGITAGDFNGDGWPDLAVAHHGGNNMGVMLNQGDGTFAPIVFYPGGQAPARIACADFDTDGNLDLAMSNYVSGDVILYFGDGRGSFRVGGSFSSHGMYPAMILTEDLNGDGWPDLATANTFGHSISVFLGNGTGLFGGPDVYPTIQYPHIFASADLDGDGAPDIVAPNNGTGSISILQNRGDGTFLPSVTSPSGGSNTRLLTVGDLNGDGLPDVITGNESSNNFSVLINNTPRPDCAVRSLTLDRAMLLGGSQSGTATVTLTTPAPPGGAVLQLASTNPAITLPATVTIPEGVTSARFTLETTPVTLTRHGAVTASYNGTVQRAAVAVRPPRVQLSGPVPNPVTGGHTATAKVTLEMPAGPGGQTITLASDTPLVVPPVTVTVPADAAEANFSIPTYPVAAPCAVLLQATGPGGASLRLQVESLGEPLPQPEGTASLPIYNPANGHWYQAVQGAALTWAQARDAAAALSYAGLPGHLATVTSANEVQFIVNHVPNSQAGSTHWIGAYQERLAPNYSEPTGGWRWVTGEKWDYTNWNGGEPNNAGGEDFVHWLPAGNWNDLPAGAVIITYLVEYEAPIAALLGIGLSPVSSPSSPTAGGQPVNGTVTLAQPAGPSPVTIYLASDYHHQGAIALPASVTVLAGQNSATFTATVYPVAADTSVVLTAIGPTASASVTVPLAGLGLPLPAVNGTAAPPVYNPANGHWYQAVQGAALTRAQARDAAAALSYAGLAGHLATVTSADEVQFIVTNVPNSQAGSTHWIGGYQDRLSPEYREPMGGWRWVTGEPWSYANWNGGEPNNAGGEDFVHWLPSGNWNDLPAGAVIISYLVEYEAPIPQFAVNQVTITPDPVIGGQSATGTVTLSQAAGPSGISVYLGSSHPEVAAVPPTVLVPAGETTATFPVTTNPVAVPTPVLIGASGPTGSASVSLQVADSGAPLPQVAGARTPPIYNPATGHWYQEVNGGSGLTVAQARSAAAGASYLGYPGHLVTVTSAEEHQFLASHLPHASECWIGLYQDRTVPGYSEPAGGWRWITGEAYSWNHWHGEPNNANGNEDWAVMRGTGSWNDLAAANLSYGYIIEYEAIEGPLLRISTRALDFGSGGVGMMGEARTLTLTNVGTAPLSISEISIDGEAAADFGFSAGGEPGILGPGESRPVTLFFRPTVSGNCVARLTLESNSRGPVEPVTLSGLGERRPLSLLAVTPDSLEFGPEPVGLSGTLIVLLHNTGNLPVNIGNINIQGPNAADFTLPMGSCRKSTLAPGSICLLNIRFSPTGTGTRSATLVIPSDAPLSPQLVLLTGIGTAPLLRLSTDSLSFTVPSTGGSSVAQTVVFTNRGDAPLAIEELVLVGQHAGSFQIVSDSGEESLDPGASRTVRVVFRSARISSVGRRARITGARIASVSYNAALQIRHNDTRPDSPQQIQLTAVETAAAAPNAPTSLKVVATAASPGPVQLTWNDTSANEAEFVLLRRTGAGLYARIAVLPPNMTSTTDTSAKPGTTYTYIMRAVNSVGVSAWSNEASVTTPAIVPPAAPMPLRATMVSATQVNLSWTDRSSNETEFVLLRKTGNGVYGRIAVLGSNTTQYADTTARPNTSYTYIMRAVNGGGFSSWSNEPSVTTPDGLPLAPTLLRATAVSAGRIELVWTDRSQDETGFVLLRKLGSGLYQRLAVLPANTTTYTDNRIAPNTSYTYIMRATNDRGVSAWTNEPSVTTPTGLPARPTNLRAVAVSATQVNLTWTDTSSNEQQDVLLRKVGSGLYQRVGVVGANTTSFVDTTVGGGTTYTYIMRAVNEFGVSAWSDELSSVTTP